MAHELETLSTLKSKDVISISIDNNLLSTIKFEITAEEQDIKDITEKPKDKVLKNSDLFISDIGEFIKFCIENRIRNRKYLFQSSRTYTD